jgi:hypothetical protein
MLWVNEEQGVFPFPKWFMRYSMLGRFPLANSSSTQTLLVRGCSFGVGPVGCTFLGSAAPKIVPHGIYNLSATKQKLCVATRKANDRRTHPLDLCLALFGPPRDGKILLFSLFCALSFAADDFFLPSSFLFATRVLCAISSACVCI